MLSPSGKNNRHCGNISLGYYYPSVFNREYINSLGYFYRGIGENICGQQYPCTRAPRHMRATTGVLRPSTYSYRLSLRCPLISVKAGKTWNCGDERLPRTMLDFRKTFLFCKFITLIKYSTTTRIATQLPWLIESQSFVFVMLIL